MAPALGAAAIAACATLAVGAILPQMTSLMWFGLRLLTFAGIYSVVLYHFERRLLHSIVSTIGRGPDRTMPFEPGVAEGHP
jgi:hypothetical protein